MRAADLARAAGISRRQIDWWHRTGRIHCYCRRHHGTGTPRHFTRREAAVVIAAGHLVNAGLRPDAALPLARTLTAHGHARLGPYTVSTPAKDDT